MTDQINLHDAVIAQSPPVADWPVTLNIVGLRETPSGGFELFFDGVVPERWKWPSNPDVPSDNFQYTVWMFVMINGRWHGAGFVQMWQDRPMGHGALPAIFADDQGVPGWRNWWGDVRKMWGAMSDYVPAPGDRVAIMVSAGNGRLCGDVSSVAERSNVVLFTLRGDDAGSEDYRAEPPTGPPDPPPVVDPPSIDPNANVLETLEQMNKTLVSVFKLLTQIRSDPKPIYRGKLFGYSVVLIPDPPEIKS